MHQYILLIFSRVLVQHGQPGHQGWGGGASHRTRLRERTGPHKSRKSATVAPYAATSYRGFFFFFTENSGCILMVLELHAKDKQPYAVQRDMFAHCRVPPPHQTRYRFPPRGHTPLRHHNSQVAANHVTRTENRAWIRMQIRIAQHLPPSVPVPARRRNHVSARARRCCCPFAAKLPQSPQRDGDSPEQRSPAQLTRQSAAARRDTRGRGGQRARARRLSLQDRCRDRCRACAESEVRRDWEKKSASHPEGSSRLRTEGFCAKRGGVKTQGPRRHQPLEDNTRK